MLLALFYSAQLILNLFILSLEKQVYASATVSHENRPPRWPTCALVDMYCCFSNRKNKLNKLVFCGVILYFLMFRNHAAVKTVFCKKLQSDSKFGLEDSPTKVVYSYPYI